MHRWNVESIVRKGRIGKIDRSVFPKQSFFFFQGGARVCMDINNKQTKKYSKIVRTYLDTRR